LQRDEDDFMVLKEAPCTFLDHTDNLDQRHVVNIRIPTERSGSVQFCVSASSRLI